MRTQHCLILLLSSLVLGATEDAGSAVRKQLLRQSCLDHFMIGIEAPLEWMTANRDENGWPWDARMAYFSGRAAKDSWDTVFLNPWNKYVNPNKERGTWGEKMFIKPTIDAGYMPWITFYNLAQS